MSNPPKDLNSIFKELYSDSMKKMTYNGFLFSDERDIKGSQWRNNKAKELWTERITKRFNNKFMDMIND